MFNRRIMVKQGGFMKNKIRILGIIAIVAIISLSMTGCFLEFGGSLTIKNQTGGDIEAKIINVEHLDDATVTIKNNESHTWKFELDGNVTYSWDGKDIGVNIGRGEWLKTVKISGGEKKVITAKDQIPLVQ